MDTLRIILIIIGIVFIFGIYSFQTNNVFLKKVFSLAEIINIKKLLSGFLKSPQQKSPSINRSYDQLSTEQLVSMSNMIASNAQSEVVARQDAPINSNNKHQISAAINAHSPLSTTAKGDQLLVTLTVLPKPGNQFAGPDIILACKLAGLQLGEYNIFHRYALVDDKVLMTPVCSLVNLFEPGYFNLECIEEFTTEGLSLFMQLPGPVDGRDAFIILMDVSEKLSLNLNATICDETRSVVTTQTISHLKEKIENHRFKLKMDSLKSN